MSNMLHHMMAMLDTVLPRSRIEGLLTYAPKYTANEGIEQLVYQNSYDEIEYHGAGDKGWL